MTALPRPRAAFRLLGRALPPLALAAGAWALAAHGPELDGAAIWAAARATPPGAWALAAGFALVSFHAVGCADRLVHQALGTGVASRRAAAAGRLAVALSQSLGFAGVTGTLARWRCLPELGPARAAAVTLAATATFGGGVALLACLVAALRGGPVAAPAALALATAALALVRLRAFPGLPGLSPGLALRLVLWTAVDVAAAAATLAVLLPVAVPPAELAAAFVAALGVGLLSQSPGGAGVFEATLLAMLPGVPAGDLLAAVLCYRLVYHAAPAVLALIVLAREPRRPAAGPLVPARGAGLDCALARAPQAEWGLVHQGAAVLLGRDQGSGWLVRRAGRRLVALGLPLGRPDLAGLGATARAEGRVPLLYKCDARTAVRARAAGWRVLRVGCEAVVDLPGWRGGVAAGRQLRRKLRAAEAAGLGLISRAPGAALPLAAMRAVHDEWTQRSGAERGFSMGRFDPALLERQAVVLGWSGDRLVAFASFHVGRAEWTLDLMRQSAAAPDGAMHAVVAHAAGLARAAGADRLSLAAIPSSTGELLARIAPRAGRRLGLGAPPSGGLGQFKRCFAPRLVARHAAAPGAASLGLALVRVAWAVRHPDASDLLGSSKVQVEPAGSPCDAPRHVPLPVAPVLRRPGRARPRPGP